LQSFFRLKAKRDLKRGVALLIITSQRAILKSHFFESRIFLQDVNQFFFFLIFVRILRGFRLLHKFTQGMAKKSNYGRKQTK
jgi:hypothetical protein